MISLLNCAGKTLDLTMPQVMAVLNVTPDSFSDGGDFLGPEAALRQARRMAGEGAAIIDIGGESTRPGAREVGMQQELDRVIPVIERVAAALPLIISIDTSKPEVMREAVMAGAGLINDVTALGHEGAVPMAVELAVPVCLMHMQGKPRTMQASPAYQDVVAEVMTFLKQRLRACMKAGIAKKQLLVDPGFGFGKALRHNLSLLRRLDTFADLDVPLLVGLSRKAIIGAVLEAPIDQRLHGSVAAAVMAAWQGAKIIRVHDVKPTVDALRMVAAAQAAD